MQNIALFSAFLEERIRSYSFPSQPSNLYDPLRYFMQLGGKRMRPMLTLMAAELFGKQKEDAIHAAISVEFFHNFSLIHDDIMDGAPLRRTQPTVHNKWNLPIAILSGDVLLVNAYQELCKQEKKHIPELINLFSKTAVEVCEGQQLDMDFESKSDVSISDYIEMIRLKTSVLLGCALEMGAIIGDANIEQRQLIYTFGEQLGVAFQIQDDILDLYADPKKFGKQVGGDVVVNKKTILLLKAFELASEKQRNLLNELLQETNLEEKVKRVRDLFDEIGVKNEAQKIMQLHQDAALNALKAIDCSDEAKSVLVELADFLFTREV